MRAPTLAAISVGALLASLVAAVPAQAEGARETTRIDQKALRWMPCEDIEPLGDETLECATLTVPMSRNGTDGETVRVALSRVPATGTAEHTLLVNPGGPGSAGRRWASYTHRRMSPELREVYDVVSFDPRGVGASTPSITCDPAYFDPPRPDGVPADADAEAVLRADAEAYAAACAENTGPLLDHVRTEDTAHDMDAIRIALDLEEIDYLGYSYGSYLGTVYSALYPDRVRALVLDSVVGPDNPWYESNLRQSAALDRSARGFFEWVARHHASYGLGADAEEVEAAYYGLRSELARDPIDGVVGPTELESSVIVVAYSGGTWPAVAAALADRIVDGDATALKRLHAAYGETAESDNGYGGYLAVQCTDSRWPKDWATWRTDTEEVHDTAPFMAWHNTWYNAPCATWDAEVEDWFQVGYGPYEHPAYRGDALIVHATGDGATPVEGSHALRNRLPGSALVIEEGGLTHGVSLTGNACVDEIVRGYLLDGELPERVRGDGPDTVCRARPEPAPRAPQSAADPLLDRLGSVALERPTGAGTPE
ncbi:alpha/beta fold hydrolase [Nocardiopsis lambiniae]|uniref:Alpha/beta fold hydrolase n=1 Tax=Nocardiopsis lambiniae TaxID=3075539 RepID=A0ABU2MHL3_9ACTN|nr:alpha/beta fold hydrolase [Nocardiopsis sp. DSM 44743]MDT0331736.1 alpha/beta fold hydrolase [Nocardiopsis sp. DSM 44743]